LVRNWKRILDDLRGVVYGDTDFGRTFPFRAFAISIWNPHSIGFVLLGCRIPLDDRYAHTSLQSSASGRTIDALPWASWIRRLMKLEHGVGRWWT
jgi:hypothetical protein